MVRDLSGSRGMMNSEMASIRGGDGHRNQLSLYGRLGKSLLTSVDRGSGSGYDAS